MSFQCLFNYLFIAWNSLVLLSKSILIFTFSLFSLRLVPVVEQCRVYVYISMAQHEIHVRLVRFDRNWNNFILNHLYKCWWLSLFYNSIFRRRCIILFHSTNSLCSIEKEMKNKGNSNSLVCTTSKVPYFRFRLNWNISSAVGRSSVTQKWKKTMWWLCLPVCFSVS